MRKSKKRILAIILALGVTCTALAGCVNKTQTQSQNSTKSTTGETQAKPDIKTIVKDLVSAGTLTQDQADKIVAAFEKNPDAKPGPNSPLESLVNDKTITEDQEHAIMDKMFSGQGGGTGGQGKASGVAPGGAMGNADTSSVKTKYLDVAYATKSEAEKMDIYLPNSGNGPFPVIIFIHGGGFMMCDKADGELTPALQALDRGYAVVSINYRLSGEAIFPAAVNDMKAAIKYVKANASKYNLNPDKIGTWGGSAGGNLSAMAGTSGDIKSLEDPSLGNADVSTKVQACVDWFGPLDFLKMDEQIESEGVTSDKRAMGVTNSSESAESKYIGKLITDEPDTCAKANPETYISANTPPFFIQHGTADTNVPKEQSINFANDLKKVIGDDKVTLTLIDGAGHGTSEFSTTENVNKVLDFFDKYLK